MTRRLFGHDGPRFVAYFWFVGWWAISVGLHVSVKHQNVEIHLPFGFLRIGRQPNTNTEQYRAAPSQMEGWKAIDWERVGRAQTRKLHAGDMQNGV